MFQSIVMSVSVQECIKGMSLDFRRFYVKVAFPGKPEFLERAGYERTVVSVRNTRGGGEGLRMGESS